MFSLFKKKERMPDLPVPEDFSFLGADMHSHLCAGIDDGAPDLETSLELIRSLKSLGYQRLITTPHVLPGIHNNNTETITTAYHRLQDFLTQHEPEMHLGVAAEYFLDNEFLTSILPQGLLCFGAEKFVLVEVSMAGWPRQFEDIIFSVQANGYTPILAHPERYLFEGDMQKYAGLKEKGVLLQMNLLSILGYYGKGVQQLASLYLEHKLYDFAGTDLHHVRHAAQLKRLATEQPAIMARLGAYEGWRNSSLIQ
ncbi:MAG: histidinol phosphatase [Bacteroidetes bacterium]|nr:histidinol phosphatase [Bacteroidota bacterium]